MKDKRLEAENQKSTISTHSQLHDRSSFHMSIPRKIKNSKKYVNSCNKIIFQNPLRSFGKEEINYEHEFKRIVTLLPSMLVTAASNLLSILKAPTITKNAPLPAEYTIWS